jgi:XTP/dITP diphosphohydrolase
MNSLENKLKSFERLLIVMDELREKCPWDKKQTLQSLRHLTIEETYELADAIIENKTSDIKKELGDLLLHIVFYSRIASETNDFDIADVCNSLCEKLIFRHPHIYGDVKVENENDVKENWEKLKLKEKGNVSVLGGVPASLPAMIKASRIQDKAKAVGFDWENSNQVFEKVKEELEELRTEIESGSSQEKKEEEFGDLLFSIINYSRFVNINPEDALEKTNKKFIKRFQYIEQKAKENNKELSSMSLAEMDVYWNEAKKF